MIYRKLLRYPYRAIKQGIISSMFADDCMNIAVCFSLLDDIQQTHRLNDQQGSTFFTNQTLNENDDFLFGNH